MYSNGVGCSSDNDLSCFPYHPFSNRSFWAPSILYSLIILKRSVIPKKKRKKKPSLEANALLLALTTAGLACLYYLTTCSLAGADRLA